ncbi:hypothetical protein KP79_PYT26402 [Mizuhopecten yessoensis]|uniref:Uncharacterized protein n=1 Tax=Mizuhopecten yessoensis TaxID=6573 RepID=A0A210Q5F7_MIZYE|nr:hypothetical protein KP79_PYT26402 [Mizuhopecten yessoensis]
MMDQVEFFHLIVVAKNNSIDVELISPGKVQLLSHWDESNSSYSEFVSLAIGRNKSLGYVTGIVLTLIFCLEFIFGVVGNVSVCVIMMKRRFLHMEINAYHASLAVADVLRVLIEREIVHTCSITIHVTTIQVPTPISAFETQRKHEE